MSSCNNTKGYSIILKDCRIAILNASGQYIDDYPLHSEDFFVFRSSGADPIVTIKYLKGSSHTEYELLNSTISVFSDVGAGPVAVVLADGVALYDFIDDARATCFNACCGGGGGGGGATTFAGLTDTPAALGAAGSRVQVNAAGTALEFVASTSMDDPDGDTNINLVEGANDSIDFTVDGAVVMSLSSTKLTLNGIFIDPPTGMEFVPQAVEPATAVGGNATNTLWINSANGHLYRGAVDLEVGGAGATDFISLSDTPAGLGTAGQLVAVNAAGTALEFIAAPAGTFYGLTDSPAASVAGSLYYGDGTNLIELPIGTAGQVLQVNAGATSPEWANVSTSNHASADLTYTVSRDHTLGANNVRYLGTGYLEAPVFRLGDTGGNTVFWNLQENGTNEFILDYGGTERLAVTAGGQLRVNNAYSFPTAAGTNGQVLQIDGAGQLNFVTLTNHISSVVADIVARDAITGMALGDKVFVNDASADPTVNSGAASYVWDGAAWLKYSEEESIDWSIGINNQVNGLNIAINAENIEIEYNFSELVNIAALDAATDRFVVFDQDAGTHGYITASQLPSTSILESDRTQDASHTHDQAGFGLTFNNGGAWDLNLNNGGFNVEVTNAILPGATGSIDVGLGSVVAVGNSASPTGIIGELRLDGNIASISGDSGAASGDVSFFIDNAAQAAIVGEAQVGVKSNAVSKGTATAGQVLTLITAATGEAEWQDAVESNYAVTNLIADADRAHDWSTFDKTENFTTGEDIQAWVSGTATRTITQTFQSEVDDILNTANNDQSLVERSFVNTKLTQVEGVNSHTAALDLNPTVGTAYAFLSYDNGGPVTGFQAVSNGIRLITGNVDSATASVGQLLSLTNVNGQVEFIDAPIPAYSHVFNGTTDWGAAVGGYLTITVPQATHGHLATSPITVQFQEDTGTAWRVVEVDQVEIDKTTGDVSFRVTDGAEFAGRAIIS